MREIHTGECLLSDRTKHFRVDNALYKIESRNCSCEACTEKILCEKMHPKHECIENDDCHEQADCILGYCLCGQGYAGDGFYCFDVNECLWFDGPHNEGHRHICPPGKCCQNTLGSYFCTTCRLPSDNASDCIQNLYDSCASYCHYIHGGKTCFKECREMSSCSSLCIAHKKV